MAKLTKETIIADLQLHELFVDQPKYKVKNFIDEFFDNIADNVAQGNTVSIHGFGTFIKYERTVDGEGTGIYTPKFKAGKAFKDAVTAG